MGLTWTGMLAASAALALSGDALPDQRGEPPVIVRPAEPARPRVIRVDDGEPRVEEPAPAECFGTRQLQGARVVALGAYEGRAVLPFQFRDDSHEVTAIRVGAHAAGPPLLLVLTAYDPVVWDFTGFPHRRLRGVLVYGYHGQGVANLPASVAVRFSTHEDPGIACGEPVRAYRGGPDLDALVGQLEQVLGRAPQAFHGDYAPVGLHVERGVTDDPPGRIDLARTRLSTTIDRSSVPPGAAGIAQLIATGAIRPATPRDIQAFNAAASRRSRSGHLAPYQDERLGTFETYVVLRAITVPTGMYGAHSASFIVRPGVPEPVDRGSHNSYYFLADGTCRGVC